MSKKFYFFIVVIISILVGFFIWTLELSSWIPYFYYWVPDAISWLKSSLSLYSNINFWEPGVNNSWVVVVSLFYIVVNDLAINPFLVRGVITGLILMLGFIYISKLSMFFWKKSYAEQLLIALGFLFSTFTIIFLENYSIFVFLYWLFPMKIYSFYIWMKWNKPYFIFGIFYTVVASMVNLPFWLLTEGIIYLILVFHLNATLKQSARYIVLSISCIIIAILPSVVYTFLSLEYTKYILWSETFYRDGTSIIAFVRWITDWGFFWWYNWQPYRPYAYIYKSIIWIFTSLWLISIIVLFLDKVNKFSKVLLLGLCLIFSLIIGPLITISSYIFELFYSLPLSEMFRNNVKFYFAIYWILLILIVINKKTWVSSILIFLACIPTLYLVVSWGAYAPGKIEHSISDDYKNIRSMGYITKWDVVLLFPSLYFPVYNDNWVTKSHLWYARPAMYWESKFILSKCIWCGNPVFSEDLKTIFDISSPKWRWLLEEYWVTKIVYDGNTDSQFYPNTLSMSNFDSQLREKNFDKQTSIQVGNVRIYDTDIIPKYNLTMCDAWWYIFSKWLLEKACQQWQKYFFKDSTHIYIPNIIWLGQILLFIFILFYLIYISKYETISNSK